ncbi:MAG: helix-turn-helix transcriptional regulator [Burkholderiales bacterium]
MRDGLLTTAEAAGFLRVSKAFLERDRWLGATIPFVRLGKRAVRYCRSELDAHIRMRTHRPAIDPRQKP